MIHISLASINFPPFPSFPFSVKVFSVFYFSFFISCLVFDFFFFISCLVFFFCFFISCLFVYFFIVLYFYCFSSVPLCKTLINCLAEAPLLVKQSANISLPGILLIFVISLFSKLSFSAAKSVLSLGSSTNAVV